MRFRALRRCSRPAAAALLAAAALSAHGILGYAHLAAEPHAICSEHGELHHVEAGADSAETGRGVADPQLTPSAVAAAHSHDHCPLCPTRRDRVDTLCAMDGAVAQVSTSLSRPRAASAIPAPIDYSTAPKQSPPG